MTFRSLLLALLTLLLTVIAAPHTAQAQRSSTTGLFLNAHLNGTGISYDFEELGGSDEETHSGGGLGLQVGYGFSPLVTLFVAANGSSVSNDDVESYTLVHADLGVQLNFRSGEQAVPYATIAFSGRQATIEEEDFEIDISGGGVTLGGGVKYFLSRQAALDLGLLGTFGSFSEVDFGGVSVEIDDINAASFRLGLGLSWFPSR